MKKRHVLGAATVLGVVSGAAAHGSMIMPPSRNSIDASPGMPWDNGRHPETGTIEPYTCSCNNGTGICNSGQSCFWFSQGVSVGCSKADGNGTRLPNLDHCPGERAAGFNPLTMEGALNTKYITTNIDAVPGSVGDVWKFNPWRAPGKGPLADPCGMAGGNTYEVFNAGAYNTTKFAKQGDLGTKVLPKRTDLYETIWKRGATEATRWEITAQHGGGYVYQLCQTPAVGDPITEECFASTPLDFAKPHRHGLVGTHQDAAYKFINATIVEEGGGKGWAINPFPYTSSAACDWNPSISGQHCKWGCKKCGAPWYAADGACPDPHCGHMADLPKGLDVGKGIPDLTGGGRTIEDYVVVPTNIPAGAYLLRWRWDCEASSQVWTTCSDITIV